MNKKTLAVVLALGVIASVGYFGTSTVLAEDNNPIHQNLVSKIAQKFNLKETDVQAVFDAVRDEKRDEMKKLKEEKLSQAVKDGVITEAQKTLILAKMDEKIENRKANREEMQKWFSDNGIDQQKLRDYLKPVSKGTKMGMRMHR